MIGSSYSTDAYVFYQGTAMYCCTDRERDVFDVLLIFIMFCELKHCSYVRMSDAGTQIADIFVLALGRFNFRNIQWAVQ